MRTLNLDEIINRVSEYSSDIKYCDRSYLEMKIPQFFNFLMNQPISMRVLERINEDFKELREKLNQNRNDHQINWYDYRDEVISSLSTRELQGAFGYFEILNKNIIEKKYSDHFIDLGNEWFDTHGGGYDKYHENFITYFFEPFIELVEWYFYESKSRNEKDYYSREEIEIIYKRFDDIDSQLNQIIIGQGMTSVILEEEFEEMKELLKVNKKKHWPEFVKSRLVSLFVSKTITLENAEFIFKSLTNEILKLA